MILRILTILFCFCSSLTASYDLSLCAIFQDEASYLKEWIEFHRLVGVKHFYLYNNLSDDNYKEVLQPYIDKNIVELIEWPFASNNVVEFDQIQCAAYNDAVKRAKKTSKWLAIIDTDEFIFPVEGMSLAKFLKKYEHSRHVGGILVNWLMYGTSNVEKIPDQALLIETLVRRAAAPHDHFKSIVNPRRVELVPSPHFVKYKSGYDHIFPKGQKPPFIDVSELRINHYWTRDEWFLHNVKIPRRLIWGLDASIVLQWANGMNDLEDKAIFKYMNRLKKRMSQ